MKELHILAKGQSTIPSCKQHFNVSYSKYGSGVIELTRFGEYSLTTSGITDVAARRTAEYKSAYNRVTMDMLHAYEAENRNYTSIHHNIPKIEDVAVYFIVCIDKYDDILFAHCSKERVKDDPKDHYINVLPQNKIIEIEKDLFYNNQNMVFLLNPECQYIVSVNQSPFMVTDTDTYDCKYKGLIYRRDNSRSKRAKDLIHSQNSIGVKELIEIQGDTKIIFPIIRGIDFTSLFKLDSNRYPSIGYLIEELKQWDGYAEKSSRGAAIFALLFERYKKYYRYSKNPDVIKIAEEKELVDCLRWVSKKLPKKYSLGDIQFLKRGKKKLPIAGIPDSLNTVRPYYYKGELIVEECSAFRMIVNLHDRISLTCHPLGASSNEDDVNYTSQMDMYQKNSYRKLKTMDNYKQYIKGYSI